MLYKRAACSGYSFVPRSAFPCYVTLALLSTVRWCFSCPVEMVKRSHIVPFFRWPRGVPAGYSLAGLHRPFHTCTCCSASCRWCSGRAGTQLSGTHCVRTVYQWTRRESAEVPIHGGWEIVILHRGQVPASLKEKRRFRALKLHTLPPHNSKRRPSPMVVWDQLSG